MSKPLIILGNGGHARVLASTLRQIGANVVGITDPNAAPDTQGACGINILGMDDAILNYCPKDVLLVNGLGSLPGGNVRQIIYKRWSTLGYKFKTVIHPSSNVGDDVVLEEGCQLMAGCIVQPGTSVGRNTIINTGAIVDHDCHIGPDNHIGPGASLSGGVTTGSHCHVGTGAVVIQSITIGDNSIIGAGAVVTQCIDPGRTLLPARSHLRAET